MRFMRIPSAAVLLALLLSLVSALSAAAPETPANLGPRRTVILIIRHAEKTGDQADRGLSKEGAQRAAAASTLKWTSGTQLVTVVASVSSRAACGGA